MKKFAITVAKFGFVLFLGACTGKGFVTYIGNTVSEDVAVSKAMQCKGSGFYRALHTEYTKLAERELAESDHQHADLYNQKGMAACQDRVVNSFGGQLVQPEVLGMWWIPAKEDAELIKARVQLVTELSVNNRTRAPKVAARAQAMFDCWVEEAHEDFWLRKPGVAVYEPKAIKRCKDAFWASMAELKGIGVAEKFIIFFAFDRSNLDAQAHLVIARVVEAARRGQSSRISIFGYTDTMGSAAYNLGLSKRRAQAVVDALTSSGVAPARITASGLGETDLRVKTANNVPERQNRRAEITVQ